MSSWRGNLLWALPGLWVKFIPNHWIISFYEETDWLRGPFYNSKYPCYILTNWDVRSLANHIHYLLAKIFVFFESTQISQVMTYDFFAKRSLAYHHAKPRFMKQWFLSIYAQYVDGFCLFSKYRSQESIDMYFNIYKVAERREYPYFCKSRNNCIFFNFSRTVV